MRLVKLWLPVILWAAVILSASNDHFSSSQSESWLSTLLGNDVAQVLNIGVRKAGHVFAYGLLGLLAWRADRRLLIALGVVFAVATIDEIHQSFTRTRTGTPWDVLLDVFGGWLAILAFQRFRRAQ